GLVALVFQAAPPCAARADEKEAGYQAEPGPFGIQSNKRIVLADAKRSKELQICLHYPAGQGPFPVIIWSHGAGGSKDNYLPLIEYWASYGYVTIQPTHSDSRALGMKA